MERIQLLHHPVGKRTGSAPTEAAATVWAGGKIRGDLVGGEVWQDRPRDLAVVIVDSVRAAAFGQQGSS